MKYKDKTVTWDTRLLAAWLGGARRQACWLLARYKLLLLAVTFSLLVWSLVRAPAELDPPPPRPSAEPRRVKEIPDFDYKYDKDADTRHSEPEALEYSDQGAGPEHNVKQAVHNYIQSHKEKIKAVNADIKDALLISSNLEDELPKQDLQRDSVRLKQKPSPSRPQRNRLNGVDIHLDTSGTETVDVEHVCWPHDTTSI